MLEVVRETPDASTFVLGFDEGGPLRYRAGQYMTVIVEIGGTPYRRAYSFCSAPGLGQPVAITVKRVAGGIVSNHLNDTLRVGDTLEVSGPNGDFTLEGGGAAGASCNDVRNGVLAGQALSSGDATRARDLVLIAGGSGITPLVSLAHSVLAMQPSRHVCLLYGNRRESDIIFRARLDALVRSEPRFRVVHYLEQPGQSGIARTGQLSGDAILAELPSPLDAEFFVCGPAPMMDGAERALLRAGVDRARIRLERFTFAARPSRARPTVGFPIRFARSGMRVSAAPGQTVLEAGLAAGVPLAFSCTMGGCGACKLRASAGAVVMDEPNCLGAEEAASGHFLACVAYAGEELTVEA